MYTPPPSGRQNLRGVFYFVCFWLFVVLYVSSSFLPPCLTFLIALHQFFRAWSLYKGLTWSVNPLPRPQLIGGEHLTHGGPIRFSYWEYEVGILRNKSSSPRGWGYLFEVAMVEFMVVKKWDWNDDLQREETELNTQRKVEMKDHIGLKKNKYEYERVRKTYGGIWKFSFDYFYFLHEITGKVFSLE